MKNFWLNSFIVNYVLFSSPQKKINRNISSVLVLIHIDSYRLIKYFWKKNQFQTLKAFFDN